MRSSAWRTFSSYSLSSGVRKRSESDQRLLADVVGRDLAEVGLGHLDVIAEDLVVADLERADPGPLPLPALEQGDEDFPERLTDRSSSSSAL